MPTFHVRVWLMAPASNPSKGQTYSQIKQSPLGRRNRPFLCNGKQSGFVTALSFRKCEQNRGVLSDFGTRMQGDAKLDVLCYAIP